jgi:two-component system, OmpR family, sensor histidine kinase BaeS
VSERQRLDRDPAWRWGGLGGKLFASYLVVGGVGILLLFLGVSYLAPARFDHAMSAAMGGGHMGMPGGSAPAMDQLMQDDVARSFREALVSSLALATGAALACAAVASFLFARRIVAPIRSMVRASHRIADGHYAERVPSERDELGELATSFNQMAESLENVERRRLALVADVAHELRTPLATIEGYAEGLLDGIIEGSPETFALIHRESGRLRRLVADLQELSRAEARQISLRPAPVPADRLVEAAVERLRPQYGDKGLALVTELQSDLPDVLADEDRTVQILVNLIGNALRYTPAVGTVTIGARRSNDQIEIAVSDTGVGLAAEQLPLIFERFYRVDRSRSRAAGGSGIGLTIARHLVEAQGGRIWAESPGLDRGTTFTFTLPIVH